MQQPKLNKLTKKKEADEEESNICKAKAFNPAGGYKNKMRYSFAVMSVAQTLKRTLGGTFSTAFRSKKASTLLRTLKSNEEETGMKEVDDQDDKFNEFQFLSKFSQNPINSTKCVMKHRKKNQKSAKYYDSSQEALHLFSYRKRHSGKTSKISKLSERGQVSPNENYQSKLPPIYPVQEYENAVNSGLMMYFSSKGVNWSSAYQLVISYNKTQVETDFTKRSDWKFKQTLKCEFIFERRQIVLVEVYDLENNLLGEVHFEIGQLVGSLSNSILIDFMGGELGAGEDESPDSINLLPKIKVYYELILPEPQNSPDSQTDPKQQQMDYNTKFMKFLHGNLKINLVACIDFTASNLYNTTQKSLHEIDSKVLNEYQSSIASISSILLNYDFDRLIPVNGFGAIPLRSEFDHLPSYEKNDKRKSAKKKTVNYMNPYTTDIENEKVKFDRRRRDPIMSPSSINIQLERLKEMEEKRDSGRRNSKYFNSDTKNGNFFLDVPNEGYEQEPKKGDKKGNKDKDKAERFIPRVSHFFPLTGDWSNCAGQGIEGVFEIYMNSVLKPRFRMSGPTLFSPMLKQVNLFTKNNFERDRFSYTVMLILTDGVIHDMEETIERIIQGSALPLSIIIVGLGDEDFHYMKILDSDQFALKNEDGEESLRDIVQFIDYGEFDGETKNFEHLAEEVLKEIPSQVCSFYDMSKIQPRAPIRKLVTRYESQGAVALGLTGGLKDDPNCIIEESSALEGDRSPHLCYRTDNLGEFQESYIGQNILKEFRYSSDFKENKTDSILRTQELISPVKKLPRSNSFKFFHSLHNIHSAPHLEVNPELLKGKKHHLEVKEPQRNQDRKLSASVVPPQDTVRELGEGLKVMNFQSTGLKSIGDLNKKFLSSQDF